MDIFLKTVVTDCLRFLIIYAIGINFFTIFFLLKIIISLKVIKVCVPSNRQQSFYSLTYITIRESLETAKKCLTEISVSRSPETNK